MDASAPIVSPTQQRVQPLTEQKREPSTDVLAAQRHIPQDILATLLHVSRCSGLIESNVKSIALAVFGSKDE